MSRKKKILITVFVCVLLAAIPTLIVGILTHEEPGLMGACFSPAGVPRYEVDGAEECPPLQWPREQIPIRVTATPGHPGDMDPVGMTRAAIRTINSRLGFRLFVFSHEGADVVVRMGLAVEVGGGADIDSLETAGGDALHFLDGRRLTAVVRLANTGTISVTHRVLVHELGHVAGLAHDPFEASVMFPVTLAGPYLEETGLTRLWITDDDRAILRRLYAP